MERFSADRRYLRLAQPKEPVAVPVRAGHGFAFTIQECENYFRHAGYAST